MFRKWAGVALLAAVVAACNPATALRKDGIDTQVQATFEQLRNDDPRFEQRFTPELVRTARAEDIAKIRSYVPKTPIRLHKAVSTNIYRSDKLDAVETADEYDLGDRTVLMTLRLEKAPGDPAWRIAGYHIQSATKAELAANNFGLARKSAWQLLFLALTVLSPLVMVAGLVKVVRTPGLRRKWLWGVIAFAGAFQFQMNWYSGQTFINYLTIQLIGAGVVKAGSSFAPWMLTFTLPVGAVLILLGVLGKPKPAKTPEPQED
jgi:hypothetical protein